MNADSVGSTLAARITQVSIAHQLEEYGRTFAIAVQVMSAGPVGPLRYVVDGAELTPGEAAERFLGGFTAAYGRSAREWVAFLAGPQCLSPTAIAYRDARRVFWEAAQDAAVAAVAVIAEAVRRVYPDAASITCASFRNEDGDDVLRLRGIWDAAGRRLAAVDDAEVDYADGWPVGGNDSAAEALAYEEVDPILTVLVDLDPTYLGDEVHTIELPAASAGVAR